ncbi:MAG: hypothetical protein AB8G26_17575 [Ilumatobacter sp.]
MILARAQGRQMLTGFGTVLVIAGAIVAIVVGPRVESDLGAAGWVLMSIGIVSIMGAALGSLVRSIGSGRLDADGS